jgi:propanol-preferring alcohol dehydrogenase
MKAAQLVEIGKDLEIRDVPKPRAEKDEAVVKVKAAGICRSDLHYKNGTSPVGKIPITLGHEISGIIQEIGEGCSKFKRGDRVCIHYLITCGDCYFCNTGSEQFCQKGKMIGKHVDGGFAERIRVPERNLFLLPSELSFEEGAVMMCSSATAFHAMSKAGNLVGKEVAIFGIGGLGISAVQLAQVFGAQTLYAVDIDEAKLKIAEGYGAIPINSKEKPVKRIKELTNGGVDISFEFVGLPLTVKQAIDCLKIHGKAVQVGICNKEVSLNPYNEILLKEAEIIGCADHLRQELPILIKLVQNGKLDLSKIITDKIPFREINEGMKKLETNEGSPIRIVIEM